MSEHATDGPSAGRIDHLGVLRFTGADARAFLQGQLSGDLRRLDARHSMIAALSSPQGRVLAVMHLVPLVDGIAAILPRELVQPTLEGLRRYVLRAKVRLEDAGESMGVHGAFGLAALRELGFDPGSGTSAAAAPGPGVAQVAGPPAEGHGARESGAPAAEAGLVVSPVGADPRRYWVLGPSAEIERRGLTGGIAASFGQAWRRADIEAGLPQVYAATREAFVAQMLNLDLVGGISFEKGCYTGQEIIARTQHLGRIKRRMHRLRLPPGAWEVGHAVRLEDGRTGRITEWVADAAGGDALAVLTQASGAASEGADGDGAPGAGSTPQVLTDANLLPLPYPFEPGEARSAGAH